MKTVQELFISKVTRYGLKTFSKFCFFFSIAALKTPEKQSASINSSPNTATSSSTPTNQHQLNSSHEESEDDANETIDDDDDDELERSTDGNSQSMHCKRNKKTRTVFSRAQVFQLESTFDVKK